MSKRCALLYGGKSGEHEVSLQSAASVLRNIDRALFEPVLIGIAKNGRWYLQPASVYEKGCEPDTALEVVAADQDAVACLPGAGLFHQGRHIPLDVVFPVLHGSLGEDGTVQGLLEIVELPYVGAGVLGSSIGMDKDIVKQLWRAHGIPTLDSLSADASRLITSDRRAEFGRSCIERFGPLMFVKPARTGSSVGITKVHSPEELDNALLHALAYDTKVMVEPALTVREIEVSVLGNHTPKAFEAGEVVPSHEFYDYEAKYIDPEGARLVVPAPLPAELMKRALEIAKAAYAAAACEGMARVDLFLVQGSNELVVNEINTIPGFTKISMFPRMCSAAGLGYSELITELITLAMDRHAVQTQLRYER